MSVTIDGTNGVTASASFYGQSTFTGTYTDGIVVDYTTGTGRITVGAADGLKIRNGGTASPTDLVTVDSSGNVGIGTSSPTLPLQVAKSGGTTVSIYPAASNAYVGDVSVNNAIAFNTTGNYTWFQTNGSERVRIDSSGNLLVGKTAAFGYTNGVTISGAAQNEWVRPSNSYVHVFNNSSNSSTVGSIYINTTTVTYNTSSDYRLKENIQPMQNALAVVQQLNPVTYTWKADGSDGQGFIAHELQAVVPDCVTGEKDAVDEDGNPVYQGIDTSFLVATLTAAIQELNAKVEALEAQLKAA